MAHTPTLPPMPPASRARRLGTLVAACVTLIAAAVMIQTWWAIEQDREIVLESEQAASMVTVRLLEEHAAQTLSDAERNLDTLITELRYAGRGRSIDDALVKELIGRAQPFNRALKTLQFVNAAGASFVGANGDPDYQSDVDDRPYIGFLLGHREHRGSVVGAPFQRHHDGEHVLPIAKNIYDGKGRYLGILSTDISVAYFIEVHARVVADSRSVVALLTSPGRVIARSPGLPGYFGKDESAAEALRRLLPEQHEGTFDDSTFLAAEQPATREYSFRHVAGYPVTAFYARERGEILAAWVGRSRDRAVYAGLFVLALSLLAALLRASLNRLGASEASLRQSEASLRRSESKFSSLFQQSPVPLALVDLDNDCFVEVNGSFLLQFGLPRERVLGATAAELEIWEDGAARQPYRERLLREGKVDELEARLRTHGGQIRICLVSARVIEAERHLMALFSPIDVTRQRRVEDEIRELNVELEERVLRRTAALEQSNGELALALASLKSAQRELLRAEKMAALGSLVAGVAHELNTPIGNALMLASTLQDNAGGALGELCGERPRRSVTLRLLEEGREMAALLVRTLQRAAELVSSFKQVAVDQSSDQRRRFNLAQTLQEILATLKPMYQHTPFTLRAELSGAIEMDNYPGALSQIITNLVSNALAHGFDGRDRGEMQLRAGARDDGQVEIRFRDDGNGIDAASLQRVFDPFYTTKLGQGGSGLGMHIVYNLVTGLLGGTITLHSEPGAGTELLIVLPRVAPAAVAAPP